MMNVNGFCDVFIQQSQPLNDEGERDNRIEAHFNSDMTATGELHVMKGFVCLMQERLLMLSPQDLTDLPEWAQPIDRGQIGHDAQWHLKAYDFAENIQSIKTLPLGPDTRHEEGVFSF